MATQILTLRGKPIDYAHPPKATDMVLWSKKTTGGKQIRASFRAIAHLQHLNELAVKRFNVEIQVIQSPFNTGVAASAGTHDFDMVWDLWIPGVDPWKQQRFFRANGFASWFRHPPLFGNHIHGFTLPPREGRDVNDDFKMAGFKVGKYVDGGWSVYGHMVTSSQIEDYYRHAFGLKGQHNSGQDHSWFPKDITATIFDLGKYIASKTGKAPVPTPAPSTPTTVRTKVAFADVSHHQPNIDLAAAKRAGLGGLYHKATEGSTIKDALYPKRRATAKRLGLPFGAYHFARPDTPKDAVAEARAFLKYATPKPGDLIPVLDLEVTGKLSQGQLKAWVAAFSAEVKRQTGVMPMLYCPWDLGTPNIAWVPRYNNTNTPPKIQWDVWQFSNGEYGSPNSFPGLGHVDLNTFRKGMTLANITIPSAEVKPTPTPVPVPPKTSRFNVLHISGQFSDNDAQHASDALNIFTRATKRGHAWVTTTEGGPGAGGSNWTKHFKAQAKAHGYRAFASSGTDAMIAVREDLIAGGWTTFLGPIVVPGKAKDHAAKRVVSVGFDTEQFGRINIIAGHYLTKGRPSAKSAEYRQHVAENEAFAHAIGAYAKEVSADGGLVFYGGDQNIVDKTDDTFFGEPLISAWDELKVYENTGHGNIDVLARLKGGKRVKAAYVRALDDTEWLLNADHWAVEAGYDIAPTG